MEHSGSEATNTNQGQGLDTDTGFDVPKDDPRRTENRGGLEAVSGVDGSNPGEAPTGVGATGHVKLGASRHSIGTTDADLSNTDHDAGAQGTGASNPGQVNLGTTSMAAPDTGPAGVGPVEGSASGATAPKVEITDVGLADVNAADMSVTGDAGVESDANGS